MSEEKNFSEQEMEQEDLIVLLDENDNELNFQLIMPFEHNGKAYVAMEPAGEVPGFEEDEVLIMEVIEDEDGEETLQPVETEEELEAAWEVFEALYDEATCDGNCEDCEDEDCEDRA